MEVDFHFHAMGVLARAAGFSESESLDMAYASQYVDDATEGEPITVDTALFEPVRTAHLGLKSFDWDVQKKVYLPFHFLPSAPQIRPNDSFVTRPNSPFARLVFAKACEEKDPGQRIIAQGIALHTLADTWAHELFTGRHNSENDVEGIHLWKDGAWTHPLVENVYLDFLPQIGHAQAGHYPDYPYAKWKYRRGGTDEIIERDNTALFAKACKTIHALLTKQVKPGKRRSPLAWGDIKTGIQSCLKTEGDLETRCNTWKQQFGALFSPRTFQYVKTAWRAEALGNEVDWNTSSRSQFQRMNFQLKKGFWESRWILFHRAAMKQRHFVLEHLL